jgi:hypothetical protein
MKLRKIPLEPLIEILTDLFDNGADFIDISGENNGDGDELRDIIKITIKPEYLYDKDDMVEELELDYSDGGDDVVDEYIQIHIEDKKYLSNEDINDLI